MKIARRLVALTAFVLVLVGGWRFAARNEALVSVYLWVLELEDVPLWQVLALAFSSGAGLVALLAGYRLAKAKLVARGYRSAVAGLETELHQLRSLPLADSEVAAPNRSPGSPRSAGPVGLADAMPGEGGRS